MISLLLLCTIKTHETHRFLHRIATSLAQFHMVWVGVHTPYVQC